MARRTRANVEGNFLETYWGFSVAIFLAALLATGGEKIDILHRRAACAVDFSQNRSHPVGVVLYS
ncbi:hypothetical protein JK2ML_0777 [Mycobacterium leprae Kyoto-2]|uniref:Uncharacterized protein n=3 Tax=Mycobacterium leprae TaxID=1769 RepID=Q9CCI8_MYCLE|nr:hypothetical protein DIJ64_04235 [Mycobacterium leprae]OAR21780.1 hypothetical protein A8144_00900 [Mycobacterium leprae 3125609]OAX72322.1 hypothetical protein A3216_00975 [Mycobacterium leprae 7935681]CAR70871.1 hypothetical protein MLBr00777 [Mycobacterium leprae Br4923]BBC16764.1 hypothetical protein JK2ML_0777 [Mycobacterium leprae Kyoto-2]